MRRPTIRGSRSSFSRRAGSGSAPAGETAASRSARSRTGSRTAWRGSPRRCRQLERLGKENFQGLRGGTSRGSGSTATSSSPATSPLPSNRTRSGGSGSTPSCSSVTVTSTNSSTATRFARRSTRRSTSRVCGTRPTRRSSIQRSAWVGLAATAVRRRCPYPREAQATKIEDVEGGVRVLSPAGGGSGRGAVLLATSAYPGAPAGDAALHRAGLRLRAHDRAALGLATGVHRLEAAGRGLATARTSSTTTA